MDQESENASQKTLRTYWKDDNLTKTFLEACIHEVTTCGRQGSSLKPYSWDNVGEVLMKMHCFKVDQRQMRNRYDYLRNRYAAWCDLKAKTGNYYDPTTNTFNFTEQEWIQHIQANKHVATLRTTQLIFQDLCRSLFDGVAATGVSGWGPSSKKNRSTNLNDDLEILGVDDIHSQ
ncbi:L10-interacting MYB domain-containing protein-like [Apium graveolens]|uniref:L10-interacting MYB domain-containing protein-like n=1 Tax=Apium graveolens TaxID=4045 RepID=UPI003D794073